MAEYDGSVRIGVKLDLDNAEKQLEHLKSRMQGQVKEITRQAQVVNKLTAEYEKLAAATKIEDTSAYKNRIAEIEQEEKAIIELQKKYDALLKKTVTEGKASGGVIDEGKRQQLIELKDSINASREYVEELRAELASITVNPSLTPELQKAHDALEEAKKTLEGLKIGSAATKEEIGATGQKIDQFNGYLRGLKENAAVADQGILDLQKDLESLKMQKQDLEAAGVGLGYEEYDKVVSSIKKAEDAIRDYKKSKTDVNEEEAAHNALLKELRNNASAADQEIVNMARELPALKQHLKDLSEAGVGIGFKEYNETAQKIHEIESALSDYRKTLTETIPEEEAQAQASSIARGQYALLSETLKQLEAQKNSLGLALGKTAQADYASLSADIDRVKQSMMECREQFTEADEAAQSLLDIRDGATVADERIVALTKELESLNKQKDKMEAAGVGLGFQDYDETVSRIREIKDELNAYSSSLGQADTKSESWMSRLGKYAKRMRDATVSAAKRAGSAVGGLMKRITNLGKNKGFEKAGRSASHFASRLKEIFKGALFFNIISRALTGLTNQLGKYLSANKNFSSALDGIKSNLLTAFQPIYDTVMPALTKLMEGLESASAKMASFIAMIFGTTASQAQQNAKDLYEQANAEEAVGDAAEDAEKKQKKFLASFDTIEKIGEEESKTSQDKKTDEKDKLGFDTAFEEVQVPQWLTDFWKVFQDSWNQYGEATVQSFRTAMDGLKAAAVSLGQVFMSVWTDGTGLAFLNQIQLLLQQILLMIGNIGTTFAQVWSSGVGEMVLHELFTLLTTILGIMTSMAASFNAVWTGGAGEAALTALLTLLATVLGIIGDIAGAFKAAWDSGAGEAALEAIAFAITAVLTMLDSVGQAFRDAWNDNGVGEKILQTILSIVTGIFNVVGELASRFKEAWEENGNGKAIMDAILGIVQIILKTFDNIVQKTVEWAKGLDLEPLISSIRGLLEALEPLIQKIGDFISDIWKNIVLPFISWLTETALPVLLDLLTGVITFLSDNFETVKTFAGGIVALFVAFNAASMIATAIDMIQKVITTVKLLFMVVQANPIIAVITAIVFAIGMLIANWEKVKETVENVIDAVVGFIQKAIDAVKSFWDTLTAGPSKTGASDKLIGGSRSGGFSSRSYSAQNYAASPSTYSMERPTAAARLLYSPELMSLSASPRMARAVETTPNTEYIAASASSRNSNGGLSMSDLEQALSNVVSRTGGGETKVDVNFTGSLAQLARILQPEISAETKRLGPDLVVV